MQKRFSIWTLTCCLGLLLLAQISCKKERAVAESTEPVANALDPVMIRAINSWLDQEKSAATESGIQKIQLLKESLDFTQSVSEPLFREEWLVIVPVKETYSTNANKERNPVNMLVLFLNKDRDIQKGFIVQYIAAKKFTSKRELAKFMYRYYKLDDTRFTGSFAYLTVADEFSHELNYENGVYRYYKTTGRKKADGVTETCYEVGFYYYWSDGTVTWQSIGNFCDNCERSKTIDGTTYRLKCGGGGGAEEPALTREMWWEVYREVATGPEPYIMAGVQFWGKKVSGEPQGGHFTQSNDHSYHTYNFTMYGMSFASAYTQSWHGTQNAYQAAQGTVVYAPYSGDPRYVNKTQTFMFSEVFP